MHRVVSKYGASRGVSSVLARTALSVVQTQHANYALFDPKLSPKPIKKLLCANRGEIATRVFRAATELGVETVAIYSNEDKRSMHRIKANESYLVGKGKSPVAAYLAIDDIINIAQKRNVDAIHPGYGFLSEKPEFSKACEDAGILFVGPPPTVLNAMGDKTAARKAAIACGIPVVPGTDGPVGTFPEARDFCAKAGFPVIIKAAFGGGGRGMRVVRAMEDLEENFNRASSEAKAAFGDGTVFIERYIDRPRHIEVQLLADDKGNVVHLDTRDCSIQRRHQKVVEIAPALNLDPTVKNAILKDALTLARAVGYKNAGTAEFLVDRQGNYYFIEVNPRVQVEHTVTEEVTGIDIVQSQILIASGRTLPELGITQDAVKINGNAIQCRVTTEDPENNFQPDTGLIEAWIPGAGMGIRIDGSAGFTGANISPHYDSLLSKVTAHGSDWNSTLRKIYRSLLEWRVRGVKTNIPFLLNVLSHPDFKNYDLSTDFIDANPELFEMPASRNRAMKILKYLGDVVVNGAQVPGASGPAPSDLEIHIPESPVGPPPEGWRKIFVEKGPEAFAKAVREHKGTLLMDTTMRDAHQSLLATRVRTRDLTAIAPLTAHKFSNLYALEMWGGATFDVALRFLKECPWDRLDQLREIIPNIPFQMLLRGANAVGYTSYPDNVVYNFVKEAKEHGVDIFRVFDSLNYVDNLRLGIESVRAAGGVVEASICYTADALTSSKYPVQYYVDLAGKLSDMGSHVLNIKDMAGLLKPYTATALISAIRKAHPNLPIHVHTHDTAGTGVASMIACAAAGADVVDVAVDGMSGLTSQPAMGAVIAALAGHEGLDTNIKMDSYQLINDYWEECRLMYSQFESGQKSAGADVYYHEMPGGQYTNLLFQAQSLGLSGQWPAIKKAYHEANKMLGDIVKVTPSSKVCGDLAQFLVQNHLTTEQAIAQADTLSFPSSVVEFYQGLLGQPPGGFPEPLRTKIIKGATRYDSRPGADLPSLDLKAFQANLEKVHKMKMSATDVASATMYPKVFDEYVAFNKKFGDVSVLPTKYFINPMSIGQEISFEIEQGKELVVKLSAVGQPSKTGERDLIFELNGLPRHVRIQDKTTTKDIKVREKCDEANVGSIGAPMPGVVVEIKVKVGDAVKKGDKLAVLSAMKMETVVASPIDGVVKRIPVDQNSSVAGGDLLLELTTAVAK